MEALRSRIKENEKLVSDALAAYFAARSGTALYQAMEYSVVNGGKRIRPFLTLEFCRLVRCAGRGGIALCLRDRNGAQFFADPR